MPNHEDEQDGLFDENGTLKDGKRSRVSMMMRDSLTPLQREIAEHSGKRPLVTDGSGHVLGLHRPGYRYLVETPTTDARDEAHRDYLDDITNAWKARAPFLSRSPAPCEPIHCLINTVK
jgi:hypothetical protein